MDELRSAWKQTVKTKAAQMWSEFTADEKTLVRFGMFPAKKMEAAEKDLKSENEFYQSKDLAVALMDEATRNGGMRA